MQSILVFSSIIVLTLSAQASFLDDFLLRWHLHEGNKHAQSQYYESANKEYTRAAEQTSKDISIPLNNQGIIAYEQGDYKNAHKYFQQAAENTCTTKSKAPLCAEVFYNLGNTLYRQGEQNQDPQKQTQTWTQAIEAYARALEANPQDTEARENKEFIQQRLQQQEEQEGEQSQKNSNEQENEQDKSHNNTEEEKNNKNEDTSGSSEKKEEKNNEEGEQSEQEQANSGSSKQGNNPLDKEVNQQIEQYMQQMEQEQQYLDDYVQRNPDAQNQPSNPFEEAFGDPFFEDFFGIDPNAGFRSGEEDPNKKDW